MNTHSKPWMTGAALAALVLAGCGGGTGADSDDAASEPPERSVFTTQHFPPGQFAIEREEGVVVVHDHDGIVEIMPPDRTGYASVAILAPTATADGTPLPDKRSFLRAARQREAEIEKVGEVEVMGQRVAGYDGALEAFDGLWLEQPGGDDSEGPVQGPPLGHEYLVDTSRGLLVLGVNADEPEDLPAAEALVQDIAPTFRWTDRPVSER